MILDHHHRADQLGVPVVGHAPLEPWSVRIGEGTVVRSGASILAGAQIGAYSLVASGAQVRPGVYPPPSLLVGVLARVVRTHPVHAVANPGIVQGLRDLPPGPCRHVTNRYYAAVTAAAANTTAGTLRAAAIAAMDLATRYDAAMGLVSTSPDLHPETDLLHHAVGYQLAIPVVPRTT